MSTRIRTYAVSPIAVLVIPPLQHSALVLTYSLKLSQALVARGSFSTKKRTYAVSPIAVLVIPLLQHSALVLRTRCRLTVQPVLNAQHASLREFVQRVDGSANGVVNRSWRPLERVCKEEKCVDRNDGGDDSQQDRGAPCALGYRPQQLQHRRQRLAEVSGSISVVLLHRYIWYDGMCCG